MLFGYIKDFTVKYVFRDENTGQIVKSFCSYQENLDWLSSFTVDQLADMFWRLKFEEMKVPWYENNFELVKLILPFFILHEFIGFFAFLLFGFVFWICYFYYKCKNEKK